SRTGGGITSRTGVGPPPVRESGHLPYGSRATSRWGVGPPPVRESGRKPAWIPARKPVRFPVLETGAVSGIRNRCGFRYWKPAWIPVRETGMDSGTGNRCGFQH
ncbi:MAG: hypothetical protein LBL31_05515, partial [Spirochaetaceae bacterium]|nr:hypothetical protein [Spirochaetaceae bacterium]